MLLQPELELFLAVAAFHRAEPDRLVRASGGERVEFAEPREPGAVQAQPSELDLRLLQPREHRDGLRRPSLCRRCGVVHLVRHSRAEPAERRHLLLQDELVLHGTEPMQGLLERGVPRSELRLLLAELLLAPAERLLGGLALAEVAEDAGVVAVGADRPRRQREFDGDLDAGLGERGQLDGLSDHMRLTGLGVPRDAGAVQLPIVLGDDELERPADRLGLGVSEDARRGRVPRHDPAGVVGGDDRVDRRLGDGAELLLGLHPLADVADDARVVALIVEEPRRQRELDRELRAILSERRELDGRADHVGLATAAHAMDGGAMQVAEPLGDDELELAPDRLGLGVPEEDGGGTVPAADDALGIRGDDRVGRRLHDGTELRLRLAQRHARAGDRDLAFDAGDDLSRIERRRDEVVTGLKAAHAPLDVGLGSHEDHG